MNRPHWVHCILLSCLVASCFGGKTADFERAQAKAEADRAEKDAGTAAPEESPGLAGLGNPLGVMGEFLTSSIDKPGPFEDPKQSSNWSEGKPHFAVLGLSGPIVEMKAMSFFSAGKGTEIDVIADRMNELGGTDGVVGALIRFGELSISTAGAEDLRATLLAFRSRDWRLVCYAERASTMTYYVMSACDTIAMPVNGSLFVGGVAASPMHLKGLLDRFGVVPDFLTVGSYKGAAEALTRPAPSPQMNETIDGILDTAYGTLIRDLAQARKVPETKMRALVDTGLYTSKSALDAGLVDSNTGYHRFREATMGDVAWKKYSWKEKEAPGIGQIMRFLGIGLSRPMGPRIAVVYALGNIVDGKGDGILGARGQIASGTLVPALRALAADDAVKAVVLRVDSGGGSALASELIAEAVAEIKAKKPVVVSMGSVAASGGYYIAAGANKIFARANTLTGSIGVVGGKLVLGTALARYGIRSYPRGRGKNALLFSSLGPWTAAEKQAVRATMQRVYDVFISRVMVGRSRTREQVLAVADGRVWTGEVAVSNGLVDAIGGLDAALAEAKQLAGLPDDVGLETYPPEPTLRDFLVSFGQVQAPFGLGALEDAMSALDPVDARVLMRLVDQILSFGDSPVQATALIPFTVH